MILVAKPEVARSGCTLIQFGECRSWCFRLRFASKPAQHAHHIYYCCGHEVLKMNLGLPNVPRAPHVAGSDALTNRALNTSSFGILVLEFRSLFALPAFLQRFVLRSWSDGDRGARWGRTSTELTTGTCLTIGGRELQLDHVIFETDSCGFEAAHNIAQSSRPLHAG
jgi:hypothetical protein